MRIENSWYCEPRGIFKEFSFTAKVATHPPPVHIPRDIAGRQGGSHRADGIQVVAHIQELLVDLQFRMLLRQVDDSHRGGFHCRVEEGCILRYLTLEDAVQVARDSA